MQRPRLIAVLPTLLTLANGACGFGAITFAAKLGPADVAGNVPVIAASLVFLAMLFDMLDGSAARLTRQTSELGAQLDSLCDAISFGVAPAFLMLQFVKFDLRGYGGITYHPRLLWTLAVLFALCALLRLARFNVETDEDDSHKEFSGLPSPAAAGTVVSFPFAMPQLHQLRASETAWVAEWAGNAIAVVRTLLPLITLAAACLMVSRLRYPHFFNQLLRGAKTRRHVIALVFAVAVIFWVHELAVPLIFCWFAFVPPVKAGWAELSTRRPGLQPSGPHLAPGPAEAPVAERQDVHRAG
ncbi:MAG: phosphatidylcholine/phosphatidylserine synthase [Planctomyces sp.]|nr:phosphatidylcholine/phosphatidylserine synthase [Planctomyces sp.]